MGKASTYHFEPLADIDVDGAVFQVGVHHYPIGPARPGFIVNAGAIEIRFNAHHTDIDAMIEALKSARRKLRKLEAL